MKAENEKWKRLVYYLLINVWCRLYNWLLYFWDRSHQPAQCTA
jgi:hypothetical protein